MFIGGSNCSLKTSGVDVSLERVTKVSVSCSIYSCSFTLVLGNDASLEASIEVAKTGETEATIPPHMTLIFTIYIICSGIFLPF